MNVTSIPTPNVPAPLPPAPPPLLPDSNDQHVTSGDSPYTDKQELDLAMRKQFPGLWQAAWAQARALAPCHNRRRPPQRRPR